MTKTTDEKTTTHFSIPRIKIRGYHAFLAYGSPMAHQPRRTVGSADMVGMEFIPSWYGCHDWDGIHSVLVRPT